MKKKFKKFVIKKKIPIFNTTPQISENTQIKNNIIKQVKTPDKIFLNESKKNVKFLTKKTPYFKIENFSNNHKKKKSGCKNFNDGRWTQDEKTKFLQGISLFGVNWKKVRTLISTRTPIQVRSHAQKFFHRMKKCKDEQLGIDFTLKTICNIEDMIKQIKSVNTNYDIINIFKYLSDKFNRKTKFKRPSKKSILTKEKINNKETDPFIIQGNNINYINNNIILNDKQNNKETNILGENTEKIKLNENINNNLNSTFIASNNNILLNNINFINNNYNNNVSNNNNINNNINDNFLNKSNLKNNVNNNFLNNNNNLSNFQTTLNNIIQFNDIYNNLLLNNYINYYNNLKDRFLLNTLYSNNINIPLMNTISMINLLFSLRNNFLNAINNLYITDNATNELKDLNNQSINVTSLNQNNIISNNNINNNLNSSSKKENEKGNHLPNNTNNNNLNISSPRNEIDKENKK